MNEDEAQNDVDEARPWWRRYLVNLNSLVFAITVVLLIAILVPALNVERRIPPERPNYRNMRSFHPAVTWFYQEQQRFPQDPGELVMLDYLPAKAFLNPRVEGEHYEAMLKALPGELNEQERRVQVAWVRSSGQYVFDWEKFERCVVEAENLDEARREIVVAHEPMELERGIHVLFGDGYVRWVPTEEIKEVMAESELLWRDVQEKLKGARDE